MDLNLWRAKPRPTPRRNGHIFVKAPEIALLEGMNELPKGFKFCSSMNGIFEHDGRRCCEESDEFLFTSLM